MSERRCALLFSLLLIGTASNVARAAACCGGGFAAPSLITGDDRAQVTVSVTRARVAADVGADQWWRRREDGLRMDDVRVEGARAFAERWQYGGTLAVSRRGNDFESRTGLGDVGLNLGYEYLPDWTYHPIRPKGLGYARLTVPVGKTAWATGDPLDARSRGFYALSVGTLLTKFWGRFDGYLSADVHYALPRFGLKPGFGNLTGLGGGWSWREFRIGGALIATYESGVAKPERLVTAQASVSYLFGSNWAATLTVSDQTLFGSPTNTSLSRAVMIWGQRRWPL